MYILDVDSICAQYRELDVTSASPKPQLFLNTYASTACFHYFGVHLCANILTDPALPN